MQLAQLFVVHITGPLRNPEVHGSHDGERSAGCQYVVEVGNDEVGIMILEVSRGDTHHQAGETTNGEQEDERNSEQHRVFQRSSNRATSC